MSCFRTHFDYVINFAAESQIVPYLIRRIYKKHYLGVQVLLRSLFESQHTEISSGIHDAVHGSLGDTGLFTEDTPDPFLSLFFIKGWCRPSGSKVA